MHPGTLLANRFRIVESLGVGGMGEVFRARDCALEGPDLALKLLLPEIVRRKESLDRLKQEIVLARRLTHRNVVRLYEFYQDGGQPFLTMELLSGRTLAEIPPHRLTAQAALPILAQIAGALAEVHRCGIIHRDVKPQNIMLTADGVVKLMDFGIAQPSGVDAKPSNFCTPRYAAPEVVAGLEPTPASDIYSFGMVARELFPSLPSVLMPVVNRCVERSPARRFQDGVELSRALAGAYGGATRQAPDWGRVHRLRIRLAVLGLAAMAVGAAIREVRKSVPAPVAPAAVREGMVLIPWAGRAFYLDRFEVTVRDYNARHPGALAAADPLTPAMPGTWRAAEAYCREVGRRLPTEAEWDFAATGGDGRPFPWGGEWREGGANLGPVMAAVGSFPRDKSPFGVFDLLGNAPEWVDGKVVRGAALGDVRLGAREVVEEKASVGFRCAGDVEK
jgi:hypothetical protein